MISVVIPTRNRPEDLHVVLRRISSQTTKVSEVIIIDASDTFVPIEGAVSWGFNLLHKHVNVRSAAIQRNIGLELVSPKCEFLSFLDDDVEPTSEYMSQLTSGLLKMGGIGISGIALNPSKKENLRIKPKGFYGVIQRIFGLDSKKDGMLLRSGVNIPIRTYIGDCQEVEWLIGCSVWKFKSVVDLRFESDFYGQSLSEDVIFSIRARERGKLFVDPNVHLAHSESEVGRPVGSDFWSMWVVNRRRVVNIASKGKSNYFRFHIANLGQFISLIYVGLITKRILSFDFMGIPFGYWQLITRKVRS